MSNVYARSVFFVANAERALRFYAQRLGFSEDWRFEEDGRVVVCQVSLFGFELILNEVDDRTQARAGHGRVFIGLGDDQREPLREHIAARGIRTEHVAWGRPTLVVHDLDMNEIFFWMPGDDLTGFGTDAVESPDTASPEM